MQNNELVSRSLVGAEGWAWLPSGDAPGVLSGLLSFHPKEMLHGEKESKQSDPGSTGSHIVTYKNSPIPRVFALA